MILGAPLPDMLVCTVAERCIRTQLAIAELVVAGFAHIEGNRSAPGQDPLALTIAHGVDLTMTARAPVVRLGTAEENMRWENTCVSRKAGRPVATFFVRS